MSLTLEQFLLLTNAQVSELLHEAAARDKSIIVFEVFEYNFYMRVTHRVMRKYYDLYVSGGFSDPPLVMTVKMGTYKTRDFKGSGYAVEDALSEFAGILSCRRFSDYMELGFKSRPDFPTTMNRVLAMCLNCFVRDQKNVILEDGRTNFPKLLYPTDGTAMTGYTDEE